MTEATLPRQRTPSSRSGRPCHPAARARPALCRQPRATEPAGQTRRRADAAATRALVTASGVTTYTDGVDYLLDQEPADHPGQEASLDQAPLRYRKLDGRGSPWRTTPQLGVRGGSQYRPRLGEEAGGSGRSEGSAPHLRLGVRQYHPTQEERDYACPEGRPSAPPEQYRQWLNAQQLCGITHWRLPTPVS